jgi:hypothetical protein
LRFKNFSSNFFVEEKIMLLRLSLFLALVASSSFAMGEIISIAVPNHSFESPTLDPGAYTFFTQGSGENTTGDWVQSHTAAAGTVNDTNGAFGAQPSGVDGTNVGWLVNQQAIWQDLADTFQVGQSYSLTVSVAARADMAVAPTDTLALILFGGRDGLNPNVAGYVDVLGENLSTTAMNDYTIEIPAVQSTDAWANQKIGIWINNTVGSPSTGYWLDNVRVTTTVVPEPTSVALFASALIGLLAYARRKR